MQYLNSSMKALLDSLSDTPEPLMLSLVNILNDGFVQIGDAIFFKKFSPIHIKEVIDRKAFFDLSGLENTTNRFHLEDYAPEKTVPIAFEFLHQFSIQWQLNFPSKTCFAVLTVSKNIDFRSCVTFSFFVERTGELVFDITSLEDFSEAVLLKKISR